MVYNEVERYEEEEKTRRCVGKQESRKAGKQAWRSGGRSRIWKVGT